MARSARSRPAKRRGGIVPTWLTMVGSVALLVLAFSFIFFVAKGCVAAQESTEVRKYVASADSLLGDSSGLGHGRLSGALLAAAKGSGDRARLDAAALDEAATGAERLYSQALTREAVPPEFEEAHPYLVSALGIRARATEGLAGAASGNASGEEVAAAVADYRLSDSIIRDHYVPAVREGLAEDGQRRYGGYLDEPEPFMDYDALGFAAAAPPAAADDPDALHGVDVAAVEVAGRPLYPGGDVVLTGADEPVFAVTVANGGDVTETAVEVEVALDTRAERQARTATVGRIAPKGRATVEVSGFIPGELDETAEVVVEAGPVEYGKTAENNTLKGTVTFGL